MSRLTERRKADREKMAAMVEALCAELGATCSRDTTLTRDRELWLEIELGEGRVGIDFHGGSRQPDVYCMPWNTALRSNAKMTPEFGTAVGAEVNPYHRAKCMGFAHGIDDLLARLRRAMVCINEGKAFYN